MRVARRSETGGVPAMRRDVAVSLIFLVAGMAATVAVSQDTGGLPSRNSRSSITGVSVAETADGVDVKVAFSELVQPEVSRLEHPDRLVFDFPGCGLAGRGQRFAVNRGPVMAVRTETGGADSNARVVVELRREPGSAQDRERAIADNKLVVNLGSVGNNLLIELGANGGTQRPALASAGNKPAANSQPLTPKSADVVPPMSDATELIVTNDPRFIENLPTMSAGLRRTDQTAPKSADVVPPPPTAPPVTLRTDRQTPELVAEPSPMPSPSVLAVVHVRDGMAPKPAEVVPPIPTAPPLVLKADRLVLEAASAAPPKPNVLPPPRVLPAATTQVNAYALLDQARALTIADLESLEAKAQAGDPQSETTLALAYHAGALLKLNDAEALRLLRQAAGRGFVPAEEALAIFCQSGFGMAPDKKQAASWYTRAAEHGSADAATNLGLMYSTGDGIPKDPAEAANWFRAAAEAGDETAQLNLAGLYHRGEGLPQDDTQAAFWLTKAAERGSLPAMLELARWDLSPEHGGHIDDAILWLKKAADLGNATAQMELGDIFVDKKLGRLDYSQAVEW